MLVTLAVQTKKYYNIYYAKIKRTNGIISAVVLLSLLVNHEVFSMKKLILSVVMLLMLLPSLCWAVEPIITSDSRTFNPLKGIYDLRGNVFVQFPVHDTTLTITGDTTQVYLYNMEVHGQGNITLSFGEMRFNCDQVDVYHSDRTAYVNGNLKFQDEAVNITADSGSYCWKTKLAAFHGNVKVNGKPQNDDIAYNVTTKKIAKQTTQTNTNKATKNPKP